MGHLLTQTLNGIDCGRHQTLCCLAALPKAERETAVRNLALVVAAVSNTMLPAFVGDLCCLRKGAPSCK